ncbi:MAG: hypothetical protein KJ042_14160 [Deltaproteobacteria bacterium]|nr:hypothetical protein [Deltaproteobacteria bacterium]
MFKRGWILTAIVCAALLAPGGAFAKGNIKKKGIDGADFQVGADIGGAAAGFIPYASATFNDLDASFSGSGGFGPIFGVHGNLYPAKNWIIHVDFGYMNQKLDVDVNFEDEEAVDSSGAKVALEDQEVEYAMNMWRFSIGAGQKFVPSSKIVPYGLVGLSLQSLRFRDVDEDDPATGTGLGPFGALGVDFQITKTSGMYVYGGGQLRLDLIYTVTPLEMDKTKAEITMGYVPFAIILTSGVMF